MYKKRKKNKILQGLPNAGDEDEDETDNNMPPLETPTNTPTPIPTTQPNNEEINKKISKVKEYGKNNKKKEKIYGTYNPDEIKILEALPVFTTNDIVFETILQPIKTKSINVA